VRCVDLSIYIDYNPIMPKIDDNELSHLFSLSKIEEETDIKKREKLLKDLSKILDYFSQLQEVDIKNVKPMTGGTFLENIYRKDNEKNLEDIDRNSQTELIRGDFPEKQDNRLKIPSVFNDKI